MFVERLVSAHDLIKSDMRASMSRETLNYYFTVKESMDAVSTFDPQYRKVFDTEAAPTQDF